MSRLSDALVVAEVTHCPKCTGHRLVDLIAFRRPFIANPDLVARFKNDWPLADADRSVLYTRRGEKGYTDFPNFIPDDSSPV